MIGVFLFESMADNVTLTSHTQQNVNKGILLNSLSDPLWIFIKSYYSIFFLNGGKLHSSENIHRTA